ncbi:hypothetical protein Val02_17570 [Virgisporangium aliadipatigenens]|uniref:Hsp70 family protein n=1 Tax=Virgisporangium aliadipatigenens TaxID=741659 RepID=A0A8J3YJ47_9ACTN|nr:Hsp70 family protein [Virgisporangium aliadipatigenens]GIJ44871.1 hypothetical protein Val02_17570 [Virgisporangium aliadipatigenens]
MAHSLLVVDCGTWATAAASVLDDRMNVLPDPSTGAPRWPSAVYLEEGNLHVGGAALRRRDHNPAGFAPGVRPALDVGEPVRFGAWQVATDQALAAYLSTVRAEAERRHGLAMDRLALTLPPDYERADPRRELVVAAASAAGFPDVELVGAATAAVLDPALEPFEDGAHVLVCDLGATWTVSLLRLRGERADTLATETAGARQDVDELLLGDLRVALYDWLEPRIEDPAVLHRARDFVRGLKHRLRDAEEVVDQLAPDAPPFRLTRMDLERSADPGLRWLLASARAVVARAGATLPQLAGVVLVGGGALLPHVAATLYNGLGVRIHQTAAPELAILRGACRWATGARTLAAEPPGWRVEPLSWAVPEEGARLLRWLVEEGRQYRAGDLLAQVRTADDRVFDLTAARGGTLVEQRCGIGAHVRPATVVGTARAAEADDTYARRHHLTNTGEWVLTPDHRWLVECVGGGAHVRVRTIDDAAVVHELQTDRPLHGHVFFDPAGQLRLVSWDPEGRFYVWDVASGRLLTTFTESGPPVTVLVNEADWRLLAEADGGVRVGRYRRSVATLWDLGTGSKLEKVVGEEWQRRHPGYTGRTRVDGFRTETVSPDGRLRVSTDQVGSHTAAVSLIEVKNERELFRVDSGVAQRVRAAFSADGRHLLANWQSEGSSWVDVWQI